MRDRVSITELTPLLFLERSADVFGDRVAVSYRERSLTYEQMRNEVNRVARALQESGIAPGDRVAYLLPNLPEMLIAHFAVPLAHAVLVAINTRLSGPEIAYILDHSGAEILVVDTALYPTVAPHLQDRPGLREVVTIHDA
ncbi:MAG: AMP-binding protein, partial [Acidimicrobiia bacterium]|nr:AMP-binding protein [Acidimicrobiia bacterium]